MSRLDNRRVKRRVGVMAQAAPCDPGGGFDTESADTFAPFTESLNIAPACEDFGATALALAAGRGGPGSRFRVVCISRRLARPA